MVWGSTHVYSAALLHRLTTRPLWWTEGHCSHKSNVVGGAAGGTMLGRHTIWEVGVWMGPAEVKEEAAPAYVVRPSPYAYSSGYLVSSS